MVTLHSLADNTVRLKHLHRKSDNAWVNNATVTMALLDPTGSAITSGVPLTYVSGSNGTYEGVFPSSLSLPVGTGYQLRISAVAGGLDRVFVEDAEVVL